MSASSLVLACPDFSAHARCSDIMAHHTYPCIELAPHCLTSTKGPACLHKLGVYCMAAAHTLPAFTESMEQQPQHPDQMTIESNQQRIQPCPSFLVRNILHAFDTLIWKSFLQMPLVCLACHNRAEHPPHEKTLEAAPHSPI
jgi:hypothetical protein